MLNQIGSERREPVKVTFGPAILNRRILTFDKTLFIEATLKCFYELLEWTGCRATEESDHRQRPLLRARGQRPHCGGTADKRDEFPSPHGFAHGRGLHRV